MASWAVIRQWKPAEGWEKQKDLQVERELFLVDLQPWVRDSSLKVDLRWPRWVAWPRGHLLRAGKSQLPPVRAGGCAGGTSHHGLCHWIIFIPKYITRPWTWHTKLMDLRQVKTLFVLGLLLSKRTNKYANCMCLPNIGMSFIITWEALPVYTLLSHSYFRTSPCASWDLLKRAHRFLTS